MELIECNRCGYSWLTESKKTTVCPKCRKINPMGYERRLRFTLMSLTRWELMKTNNGLKSKQIGKILNKKYGFDVSPSKISSLLKEYDDARTTGSKKAARWIIDKKLK